MERYDSLLGRGAVLVNENDHTDVPRVLVYLQHAVVDGRADPAGNRRTVSKRFQFVEVDPQGHTRAAGLAPYLDFRPAIPDEMARLIHLLDQSWLRANLDDAAIRHGVELARVHLDQVRRRTLDRVERTSAAVMARLLAEIRHWDHRANQLREQELAGKLARSGMNSAKARQRARELPSPLKRRLEQLDAERQQASAPPVFVGGGLVVPAGMLALLEGVGADRGAAIAPQRAALPQAAVDAVVAARP